MLTRNEVLQVFLVHDLDNPITLKSIINLLETIDQQKES